MTLKKTKCIMHIESKILKLLIPYLGTTLIVCGYIKLSLVYNHFNIEIYNYLEFSEIITLFMPDIVRNSIILFGSLFIAYLVITSGRMEKNAEMNMKIIDEKRFFKRLKLIIKHHNFLAYWVYTIIVFSIVEAFRNPDNLLPYILNNLIIPSLFLFNILEFEFRRKYKLINGNNISSSYTNLSYVIFLFFLYTVQSSFTEIKEINKEKKMVEFIYNKESIKSDSQNKYIGQTRNYIFLVDECLEKAHVYDKKMVSNLIITQMK
ncbi:hypothetical protein [Pontimicrobium aquaticum]|uniref:Uncharacterized protein n=1 Tax=Pontimicrobium aquaticum TaxID=2565367 RepID=A0A4U0F109_9FLAO|nr:hypothetical protein [Pontimicrobium aquaticum]TJY37928.1 hypothetical protein E5167_01340 [Pontimicrobium aquaticum]